MKYVLWNKDKQVWFKEQYDTMRDARMSAYRKRCAETSVCIVRGEMVREVVGTVMNKGYNKYGRPIYISHKDDRSIYYLNPDGSLKKVD